MQKRIVIAALMALSACGGASTGGTDSAGLTRQLSAVDGLVAAHQATIDAGVPADLSGLSRLGAAKYSGQIGLGPNGAVQFDRAFILGDITASINLSDDSVSGTASNFHDLESRSSLSGELTLTGTLDRDADAMTQVQLRGDLDGTLTSASQGAGVFDLQYGGDLLNGTGEVMHITPFGTGTFTRAAGRVLVDGIAVLERE